MGFTTLRLKRFRELASLLCLFVIALQLSLPAIHHLSESREKPCSHALLGEGLKTPEDPTHHQHDALSCQICTSWASSRQLALFSSTLTIGIPSLAFEKVFLETSGFSPADQLREISPRAPPLAA